MALEYQVASSLPLVVSGALEHANIQTSKVAVQTSISLPRIYGTFYDDEEHEISFKSNIHDCLPWLQENTNFILERIQSSDNCVVPALQLQ